MRGIDQKLNSIIAASDLAFQVADAASAIVFAQTHGRDVNAIHVVEVVRESAVASALVKPPGLVKTQASLAAQNARARRRIFKNIGTQLFGVEVRQTAGVLNGLAAVFQKWDVFQADGHTNRGPLRE